MWRKIAALVLLFGLYQSAEGIGLRLLGSQAAQAGLMLACLVIAWPVGRWLLRDRGYAAYALGWQPRVPLWLGGGVALAFVAKGLSLGAGLVLGAWRIDGPIEPAGFAPGAVGFALLATFVPSITEDIITRGFWWRQVPALRKAGGFVLFSSLVYLFNHIYRLDHGPAEWLMLLCFGAAYATALARTGSLWPAVGLHWGWNLANALLDLAVPLQGDPQLAPWLSAAAHLLMLAVLLAMPIKRLRKS